jgi:3-methyladenine DNA glycosylase AlkD
LNDEIVRSLNRLSDPLNAANLQRFFKTGVGQYGEGDKFLGVSMPKIRIVAKKHYKQVSLVDIENLLSSPYHEIRMSALILMTYKYKIASPIQQKELFDTYISHIGTAINNWDLVDVTAPRIVGAYLYDKDRNALYDLASGGLWHKRVSIISTFYFISNGDLTDTVKLAELLLYEKHDLLHKAVGWSLREVGKKDIKLLYGFLDKYSSTMPRTALRYSLEKLQDDKKYFYMNLYKHKQ